MEWKALDYRKIAESAQDSAQGQNIDKRIVVSPYTIPEAYRVYASDSNFLTLEFRYFSPDSNYEEVSLDHSIVIKVGKQSSRIFSIRFNPLSVDNVEEFRSLFKSAINSLRIQFKHEKRFKGFVGENLIKQERDLLENQFSRLNNNEGITDRSLSRRTQGAGHTPA